MGAALKTYHRTSVATAAAILAGGFRDGRGSYMTESEWTGVWISNEPLDENEGARGDAVLEVTIDGRAIRKYEWIQDIGYREWLVPAVILNMRAHTRLLTEDEVDRVLMRRNVLRETVSRRTFPA